MLSRFLAFLICRTLEVGLALGLVGVAMAIVPALA